PEFSNPLFLRLFCESISNRGWRHVPDGLDSLTAVFEFFLDSVNRKLARPEHLDFDNRDPLVLRAVEILARRMAESNERWIRREEVRDQLNTLHPSTAFDKSLLRHLLSEGVLADDRFVTSSGPIDGIRFSYERFSDHAIAKFYLDTFLDETNPGASFAPDKP